MIPLEYTADEVTSRGAELYGRDLRAVVEPGNAGRFLVLDVVSGKYEIADDVLTATLRLPAREPGAITYGVRIGHRDAYRMGSDAPGARL
jgi:hypothetical protein